MNMKLQAEKHAQPAGMRVGIRWLADDLAGVVAGAGDAAGRTQPDFVDRRVGLERILELGRHILVDLPLGAQHALPARGVEGEPHRSDRSTN